MRAFLISDTHFGYKNSSKETLDMMKYWWENEFLKVIDEEYEDGDIIIHLGDLFDIRSHTEELVRYTVVELIKETIKFPLHFFIIAGNHDVYYKTKNDISSLDSLNHLVGERLTLIKEPIHYFSNQILFAPWEHDLYKLGQTLQKSEAKWVFMHADIEGLRYNKDLASLDRGLKIDTLSKFKGVFSGHIHWSSSKNNVHYVGTPYQLDRSEIGNKKSIKLLDFNTGEIEYFYNDISPKFRKVYFTDLIKEEQPLYGKNDKVDVILKPSEFAKFRKFISNNKVIDNYKLIFEREETEVVISKKVDLSENLLNQMLKNIEDKEDKEFYVFTKNLIKDYENKSIKN